jgi:hypothetical protein
MLNAIPDADAYPVDPDPQVGEQFRYVLQLAQKAEFGPIKSRVFLAVAAYADAHVSDPSLRQIAGRAKTTKPNAMFLLRDLELDGYIKVKWTKHRNQPHKYKIIRAENDGE